MPAGAAAAGAEADAIVAAGSASGLALFLAGRLCLQALLHWRSQRRPGARRPVGTVSQVIIYPVKSCLGVPVTEARVTPGGLVCQGVGDRSFAVVSLTSGKFVSLKSCPRLALVQPVLDSDAPAGIRLTTPEVPGDPGQPVTIRGPADVDAVTSFDMFGQATSGLACDADTAVWLRRVCRRDDLTLVHCSEPLRDTAPELRESQRLGIASAAFPGELPASWESRIAFANTAPLLVVTEVAIATLNQRLAEKGKPCVDWRNFRPNLVLYGPVTDRVEETWSFLFLGDSCVLALLSPCTRCGVTTVDYDHVSNAETRLRPDGEPLNTLADYRKDGAFRRFSPVFGVNGFVERPGQVTVGCPVFTRDPVTLS